MWIAIEYSYKLGQKNEFEFLCELGWFSQRQSHMVDEVDKLLYYSIVHNIKTSMLTSTSKLPLNCMVRI